MQVINHESYSQSITDATIIKNVAYITVGQNKILVEKKESSFDTTIQGKKTKSFPFTSKLAVGIAVTAATTYK